MDIYFCNIGSLSLIDYKYTSIECKNIEDRMLKKWIILYNEDIFYLGFISQVDTHEIVVKCVLSDFNYIRLNIDQQFNHVHTDKLKIYDISKYIGDYNFGVIPIKNIGDYIDYISAFTTDKNLLYRGIPDQNYRLQPSVFRKCYSEDKESKMYKELRKKGLLESKAEKGLLDMVVEMQHIGIPTRLLDWSSNPLVSLFFAVSGIYESKKDAYVYVHIPSQIFSFLDKEYGYISRILEDQFQIEPLNPTIDDEVYTLMYKLMKDKVNHIFIELQYQNARVEAQDGYFSAIITPKQKHITVIKSKILQGLKLSEGLTSELMKTNFKGKNKQEIIDFLKTLLDKEEILNRPEIPYNQRKILLSLVNRYKVEDIYERLEENKFFDLYLDSSYDYVIELSSNTFKFSISRDDKVIIRKQLDKLGINHKNIYPDNEGFILHLKDKFEEKVI